MSKSSASSSSATAAPSGTSKPRSYGSFHNDSTASSLFDQAFAAKPRRSVTAQEKTTSQSSQPTPPSDSVQKKKSPPPPSDMMLPSVVGSSRVKDASPKEVFSPPVSIPDSTDSGGLEQSDSSGEDEPSSSQKTLVDGKRSSQSSTSSLSTSFKTTSIEEKSSPKKTRSAYDFDEDEDMDAGPDPKKSKTDELPQSLATIRGALGRKPMFPPKNEAKETRHAYKHKWVVEDEEEEETDKDKPVSLKSVQPPPAAVGARPKSGPGSNSSGGLLPEPRTRVRNVKEAHQCLESGEHLDFQQDLDYALSSLSSTTNSFKVKCLSAISLARSCVSSEFRQFVRSQNQTNAVFKAMADSAAQPHFALCASAVVYLMARDFVSMAVDSPSLRLFVHLLKIDRLPQDPEKDKYIGMVWDVFKSYTEKMEQSGKKIQFDFTRDTISPSSLILEALVFILKRDPKLKTEMLDLGALQWIVSKVERIVLALQHDTNADKYALLVPLERCFRILESCTLLDKRNQAFLISHRGSILIQSCGRLIAYLERGIEAAPAGSDSLEALVACLCLLARVLTNLSHENGFLVLPSIIVRVAELCCTKLGQMSGFLALSLSAITYLGPKYAAEDKKFDMLIMMSSLLVNVVERCNANRRKVIALKVMLAEDETEVPALAALTKMFLVQEAKARLVDEDLDRDLAMEDPEEGDDEEEGEEEGNNDGRLNRAALEDMSENEIFETLQSAMNKASAHMEDSVCASYIALLIGCLLQQNEESVEEVRELMPEGSLSPLVEQLQRFLDFMKLTNARQNGCRAIERIIDLVDKLNKS